MNRLRTSPNGLRLIKQFEGFSAVRYLDAAGLPTIGYGHLLTAQELSGYGEPLDADRAHVLLAQDVVVAENAIARFITVPLSQNQFDALVSFTFNLGAATLQRSTLRRVVNRGDHADVPEQLERFVWAGGRKLAGLIKRRAAEAQLYMK